MGVITLLTDLIKCPSFTPTGFMPPSQQLLNFAACKASLDVLEAKALAMGFEVIHRPVFVNLHPEFPYPVENLILRRRKGSPKRSLCFLGHTDLFPTKVEDWSVDPFGAEIKDGYLFGRGATDMKGGIAAWLIAVEEVIDQLDDVDIYVVITTDEEAMALNGTRPTLEWMYANGHKPTAFIVGEPSSNAVLGDSVRPGRRGCMGGRMKAKSGTPAETLLAALACLKAIRFTLPDEWSDSAITRYETTSLKFSPSGGNTGAGIACITAHLKVAGIAGHTAYPGTFTNPSDILRSAIATLQGTFGKERQSEINGLKFSHLMNIGGIEAVAEGGINLSLTGTDTPESLAEGLQQVLDDAGFARNTVQLSTSLGMSGFTHSEGDIAEAAFNIRFTGNYTPEELAGMMQQALVKEGLESLIELNVRTDLAARPYNSVQGRLSAAIRAALAIVAPGVTPLFNREGGSSDGRFVQEFDPTAEVIEFGSCYNGGLDVTHPDYGLKGGLHMVDERIKLEDLYNLVKAYGLIIRSFFAEAA